MFAFVRNSIPNFIWPAPIKGLITSPQASASDNLPSRTEWPCEHVRRDNGTVHRVGPNTKALIELPPCEASDRHPIPIVVVQATLLNSIAQPDTTIKSLLSVVKQLTIQTTFHGVELNSPVIPGNYFICKRFLNGWQLQTGITCSGSHRLAAGPYLVVGNCIHEAWKLFPDTFDSFVCGIMPRESDVDQFGILDSNLDIDRAVAVPSRWYYTTSAEKPLNGMRVTIKDNFRIENIKTTQTNRAWTRLNEPEAETADFVQRLKGKGAIIIGKTKMCSFASSEEATDGWIDFHAPFNPRADGYQSSSGSTTGGATSLAGHDWIDISIGTDTTGSIRWPAAWHGLFGLRMTHNPADMKGVYPSCHEFDALGLLGRSLRSVERVTAAVASGDMKYHPQWRPSRILFSTDFLPWGNSAQQAMVKQFVHVLEKFLGMEHEPMSIAKLWEAFPPKDVPDKSLSEYIENTAFSLFYSDGYREYEGFRTEYHLKFGKPPYVGPYMRWKWERGALITDKQYKQAKDELEVYREWFQKNVIGDANKTSGTILILPCGPTEPKYRDDPNKPPSLVAPFSTNYIASMIGLPQLVVPIGQLPYKSRVSGRTEYLPVVSTIVGPRNSDLDLIRLAADALTHAGWATTVKTGKLAFELGTEETRCPIRNVEDPPPSYFGVDPLLPTPEA